MSKQVYNKLVTPVGVSQYCWLNTPDTKFDKENGGHFKTNLILKGSDAQHLIKGIKDEMKKSLEIAKEKSKGKEPKTANMPFEEEYVEETVNGKKEGNNVTRLNYGKPPQFTNSNNKSLSNSPTGAAGIKTRKNKKPGKRTKRK